MVYTLRVIITVLGVALLANTQLMAFNLQSLSLSSDIEHSDAIVLAKVIHVDNSKAYYIDLDEDDKFKLWIDERGLASVNIGATVTIEVKKVLSGSGIPTQYSFVQGGLMQSTCDDCPAPPYFPSDTAQLLLMFLKNTNKGWQVCNGIGTILALTPETESVYTSLITDYPIYKHERGDTNLKAYKWHIDCLKNKVSSQDALLRIGKLLGIQSEYNIYGPEKITIAPETVNWFNNNGLTQVLKDEAVLFRGNDIMMKCLIDLIHHFDPAWQPS